MKKSLVAAMCLAAFGAAQADDGLTANVALTTKYKYRGQDQSDSTKESVPAIQGGFDYTLGGFYLGNWNSSIGFAHGTEVDVYGGYRGTLDYSKGWDRLGVRFNALGQNNRYYTDETNRLNVLTHSGRQINFGAKFTF